MMSNPTTSIWVKAAHDRAAPSESRSNQPKTCGYQTVNIRTTPQNVRTAAMFDTYRSISSSLSVLSMRCETSLNRRAAAIRLAPSPVRVNGIRNAGGGLGAGGGGLAACAGVRGCRGIRRSGRRRAQFVDSHEGAGEVQDCGGAIRFVEGEREFAAAFAYSRRADGIVYFAPLPPSPFARSRNRCSSRRMVSSYSARASARPSSRPTSRASFCHFSL